MTILHTAWAMKNAPVRSAFERLVLLFLADYVNDERDHRGTLPPLESIARVACVDEDAAARILLDLVTGGALRLDDTTFELKVGGRE